MIKTTLEDMQHTKINVELTQQELMILFLFTGIGLQSDTEFYEKHCTEEEKQALYALVDTVEAFISLGEENDETDAQGREAAKKLLQRLGLTLVNSLTVRH